MSITAAALVLVGLMSAVNLVLSVGVIKRLREHTQLLSVSKTPDRRASLGIGEEVGQFEVSTVDGLILNHELFPDDALVGFFSPSCQPCREKLPAFLDYARELPGGRNQVIAAVVGGLDSAHDMIEQLNAVAQVILQADNQDTFGSAFEIMAFPTVLKVRRDSDSRLVITDDRVDLSRPTVSA